MAYNRYALQYSEGGTLLSQVLFPSDSQTLLAAMGAPEWKRRVMNSELPGKAIDLTATVKSLMSELLNGGAKAVDLSDLRAPLVNGRHLAVVLRATYTRRSEMPGWKKALEVAKVALLRDGANVEEALYGLLNG
ncbi:hypothetical protein [Pelomonas sp. KK5]|uniref:hypothetical protein n=1 Tax=Pelomonas sp. KK5 TaxID=1855730 RepID=UPI0011807821|nr:hypothetical protein [Pelomonas sp. KK5]